MPPPWTPSFRVRFPVSRESHAGARGDAVSSQLLFEGTLNRLEIVEHAGRRALLRRRIRPDLFRYEPGIAKEALVAALLTGQDPAALQLPVQIPGGVMLYDYGHDPAWSLQELAEGESLLLYPQPYSFGQLGAAMARLHACRFDGFYPALTDIGRMPPQRWAVRLRTALAKELPEARAWAPAGLDDALAALVLEDLPEPPAVLVHNDLHGDNILLRREDGRPVLLDWDNAVVDAAELDFVKLRHWTRLRPPGLLTGDEALWQAAVDGYVAAGGTAPDPLRLALYEVLWLMRLGNFEASRGHTPPPFRPLPDIRATLAASLERLAERAPA